MGTHYHLIVWQRNERGVEELMRRVTTAYSRYFNAKYNNHKPLFRGRYRSKLLDTPEYFRWAVGYVHDNHESGLDYEFSSHRAWVDPDLRPGWLDPDPAVKVFGGIDNYITYLGQRTEKRTIDQRLGFGGSAKRHNR
jgi:hypothetical protein